MKNQQALTAETELGHRRGVVLGLTMAELLLLLVFCLLLASVAVVADKEKEIKTLKTTAPEAQAATEKQLQETETTLQNFTANAPQEYRELNAPLTSDDWTELVRGREIVREMVANGITLTAVPEGDAITAANELQTLAHERDMSATTLLRELLSQSEITSAEATPDTPAPPPGEEAAATSGHQWPPIITLGSDKFRFELNSAELTPDFRTRLQLDIADQVRKLLAKYDVNVVEVVGHTDEAPINSSQKSTLDADAIGALNGTIPITDLKPADNAGLGLARAIAVANALRAAGLPPDVRIIPLSAAQLLLPGDRVSDGSDSSYSTQRRRIEIRVRKSTGSLN